MPGAGNTPLPAPAELVDYGGTNLHLTPEISDTVHFPLPRPQEKFKAAQETFPCTTHHLELPWEPDNIPVAVRKSLMQSMRPQKIVQYLVILFFLNRRKDQRNSSGYTFQLASVFLID